MRLEDYLEGCELKNVELDEDSISLAFHDKSGMTIYSDVIVDIKFNGKPLIFSSFQEFEDRFELIFSPNSIVVISRTLAENSPEIFVYRSASGQYVVD
ncbi:hypothetical protein RMR21_025535 (plasmid) [Agrobacterium sp. rho-8.1]|nr:hypothetical protein [Agrobacterium sp. rho-8.1]